MNKNKFMRIYILLATAGFFLTISFVLLLLSGGFSFAGLWNNIFKTEFHKILFGSIRIFLISLCFIALVGVVYFFFHTAHAKKSWKDVRNDLLSLPKKIKEKIIRFIPSFLLILLNLFMSSIFLEYANMYGKTRLLDDVLMRADHFIFGFYPFIALGNISFPGWFAEVISASYLYIGFGLIFFAGLLFIKKEEMYYRFVASFFFTLALLSLCWTLVPALTPCDRYVKNYYNLPIPEQVREAIQTYHPQPEIAEVCDFWLQKHEPGENASITSIPSAHIVWISLLLFYMFRYSKKLFALFLPFLLFSALGTLLFAMHYSMDVISAVPLVAFGIFVIERLARKTKEKTA